MLSVGRWRGQGARFVGCKGGRYKLGWSGNTDGIGEVGILVKELCEKLQKSVEKVTE